MESPKGYLEVGINDKREVVVNLDHDRTGHITFSPKQAADLGLLLLKKAVDAEVPDGVYRPIPVVEAQGLSARYEKSLVIVLAWDPVHALTHSTTYGRSAFDKEKAAEVGDFLVECLGGDLMQKKTFADFHDTFDPARHAEAIDLLRRVTRHQGATPQEVQQIENFLKRQGHVVRQG